MNSKNGHSKVKLHVVAFGIALGVTEALYMLVLAWVAWLCSYGTAFVHQIATIMPGYGASFLGGIIGGGYGFIDGFLFGIIASLIYNCCTCCCCKKKEEGSQVEK